MFYVAEGDWGVCKLAIFIQMISGVGQFCVDMLMILLRVDDLKWKMGKFNIESLWLLSVNSSLLSVKLLVWELIFSAFGSWWDIDRANEEKLTTTLSILVCGHIIFCTDANAFT